MRPGDSPASIAARDEMAGCPRCSRDLVHSNPHKEAVVYPNGFLSFRDLQVGEKLNLPEKWFDGSMDSLPRSYFAALPHPDGVTPSKLGLSAAGVLGDYSTLDTAAAKVSALSGMSDQQFTDNVSDVANTIDASVQEISGNTAPATYAAPYTQDVRKSTNLARQQNATLAAAISANDEQGALHTRVDILHDFSDALASARLALQAFHGDSGQTPTTDTITAAAKAAAAAIASDPSFCSSIAHPGTAVNSAVHAFKTAWNAANPSDPVPINTGTYEQATADVLTRVLGSAPAACTSLTVPSSGGGGSGGWVAPPQENQGLSVGAILGLGLLGVGAVGGVLYFVTREAAPPPRVRRVRPARPNRPQFPSGPERFKRDTTTIGPWRKNP